ncbi:signal peptidase II [Roseibium sp. RKSG952]|uniref:signal peptidase II n=1 Tax=Roseibium sp. RKSG952 TaxID=2529384 RepID=UPI0012BBB19C|nr:signal peptidase II [Roseibium sp. RKSG952]MTI00620.1 signal peptidase II [Roseibium sp. RKSG952]
MEQHQKRSWIWGRFSHQVLAIAIAGFVIDQAVKLWLLYGFKLGVNGPVDLTSFLEIVLVWNRGISYGLFQQYTEIGRLVLVGVTVIAACFLWVWGTRATNRLVAVSLGLIIGGAFGNGLDRLTHGAVVDFVHFHAGTFSWYVFNLADVWIVAGVIGLLYDSFQDSPK